MDKGDRSTSGSYFLEKTPLGNAKYVQETTEDVYFFGKDAEDRKIRVSALTFDTLKKDLKNIKREDFLQKVSGLSSDVTSKVIENITIELTK